MKRVLLFVFLLSVTLLAGCISIQIRPMATATVPFFPTITETPDKSPTPTEEIIWFPPTATPRPLNTPTPFLVKNSLPQHGDILLWDDFSSPETWQTFRGSQGNAVINNNELTLAIQSGSSTVTSFANLPQHDNYVLEMDVNLSICSYYRDQYGVLFRVGDSENTYRWLFNCQGETRIDRLYRGKPYLINNWAMNGALRQSAPQKFTLRIVADGHRMNFFINDTEISEVYDTTFDYGGYGLTATSSGYQPISVSFSDFRLYAIK